MNSSDAFPFRIPGRRGNKPTDPESLFRSLSQRAPHVQYLWAHQADVLRTWHSNHEATPDLALELPTGTGKTLIGLLIGEFVRQTRGDRVAYLCPNRQLAHQVVKLAGDYSIKARVLVGPQASYDQNDFSDFEDSSAIAVTTYSAVFNTNPRIESANLLILDDAHASEDFIASLWNVEVDREDHKDIYFALLDFFKDVIPGSQLWNLKSHSRTFARNETDKIPSTVTQIREQELRAFVDTALADDAIPANSSLRYPWRLIRGHLHACHIFITWSSISIRPVTPPTFSHAPFASALQRLYMSATLGEGGELERITGVRKIERLPVPEGWDRQGTGRRFILFPDRSLPPAAAITAATTLTEEASRSLILTPNRNIARSVSSRLSALSPRPAILSASDIEHSLESFLNEDYAALVLHNRYDGLDLPGEACHFEWIFGLPGATNAQEAFLLDRLGIRSLFRDRIKTRLTQALGRCTRTPTDHAVVLISGTGALDFCIKSENRSGFHPELQAEIQYGLEASQVDWPNEFLEVARPFMRMQPGWEKVDQWIREERDSYQQEPSRVAEILMSNVGDEIDYSDALWAGNYQNALTKARACADRLGGDELAEYRAWWYYLAGSAATLSAAKDNRAHLRETARDLFARACAAAPRSSWFQEVSRSAGLEVSNQSVEDPMLLAASEAIERKIQQVGVAGAGFESAVSALTDQLNQDAATQFEQGLEQLGAWLGLEVVRPTGDGVPDGVWLFSENTIMVLEAKSNEQPAAPISLRTAREAQGHINWVKHNMQVPDSTRIEVVILSDRSTISSAARPNVEGLYIVGLASIRELGQRTISTIRAIRAESSESSNEEFRRIVAKRLKEEGLDPKSLLAALLASPLSNLPTQNS